MKNDYENRQKGKFRCWKILVLDIQDDYLILFNDQRSQFIKANGYKEDYEKVFWNGGEYYDSLNELIQSLNN